MTCVIRLLGRGLKDFKPEANILTEKGSFTFRHVFILSENKYKRFTSKKSALRYIEIIKETLLEYKDVYEEVSPGSYYRLIVLADNLKVEPEV